MKNEKTTFMAIGGGDFSQSQEIMDEIFVYLERFRDPIVTVMTVATSEAEAAASKYNRLFRSRGVKHVNVVNIDLRGDAFSEQSIQKLKDANAIFFTGGDQLNVTSLLGGSPLHDVLHERFKDGVLIIGTSAGAAMMSTSMIISGKSDAAPRVGGVEIAPGMNMMKDTIIDSHFSQRGRHGRLLNAVAHYPQSIGIGIDERTAVVAHNGGFKVLGDGVVTIVDGSRMRHSDLPYRHEDETIGMFGVDVHVLPAGYTYDFAERRPQAPPLKKMAGSEDEV